jgi:hypothetical protein
MTPLVTDSDSMSTLAHGIVAWLPLWIALAVVVIVSVYVVMFGRR